MKIFALIAIIVIGMSPAYANTAACPQPGQTRLPLNAALDTLAIRLTMPVDETGKMDFESPMDQRVLPQLANLSESGRDASLLALLKWHTIGTLPLFSVTMYEAAPLFETYFDVLSRNGLDEAAAAMLDAKAAFPVWNIPIAARYAQWSDGRGTVEPVLDAKLKQASERFMATMPAINTKAEELANLDRALMQRLSKILSDAGFDQRFRYLVSAIYECLPKTDNIYETMTSLDEPLQHTLHINWFLQEAGNGAAHQYFYNSTGDGAPQFQATLQALGLPQQASDLKAAMDTLGDPYPTDTEKRRAVINGFNDAQNEALYQPTWIMDTLELYETIEAHLRETGYWPL